MERASKHIFISYAHEDIDIVSKLSALLDHFPNVDVTVWSDGLIRFGANWDREIQAHLEQADLAMLLVSGAFGGSNYINCSEIPVVRDRASSGKSDLLWLAVDEAGDRWAQDKGLGALKAAAGRKYVRGQGGDAWVSTVLSEVRMNALSVLDPEGYKLQTSLNAKYQLKTRLGGGRSWHIYLASDRMLRRDVAVYCPADDEQRDALERTVTRAAEQAGPSMATIYGAWLDANPMPHVIAQYASRGTLAKRIAEMNEQTSGGLPCEEVRRLIIHLARALSADAQGKAELLELRPSKILVDESAGYMISPFGRWRWRYGLDLRRHLHATTTACEERAYVAPELLLQPPNDPDRTYQYLLGLLAWHAIVGKLPATHNGIDEFPEKELPEFGEHLPSPNADRLRCSPWLAELIVTMTAKEPDDRLQSLQEVVRRLSAAPAEELGLVRISYERCLQSEGGADAFFGKVYERLKALLPEREWKKFPATLDWHVQHANLAEAIALLLAFYAIDASNQEPTALSRIARKHGRSESGYKIAPASFPLFQRALIDSVIETLKLSSPEEAEGLRTAWGHVLKPGIKYLAKQVSDDAGS
jgi:serine/threonine protein kinase